MKTRVLIVVCVLAFARNVRAQEPFIIYSPVQNLATLFTGLFGPQGLKVDSEATLPGEQPHTAHFNSDFQSNFDKFTTAIVGQLVTVPLPSPASGFTYELDPNTGVFKRSTDSFGPILAERAETVGAGRVSVGFAFQRFNFQTVEGLDLNRVPAVFTHDNAQLLGGRQDVITTLNSIEASVAQYTTYLTIGITDRFDVSAAMKVVSNDLKVQSKATVQRLGTTNELTHFFRQADGGIGNTRVFWAIGHASGLGDTTVRLKANVDRRKSRAIAAGLDIRLPTGDQMNLLGTGTAGLAPFVILSSSLHRVSPHFNASYQWNGKSILAGNPATGESDEFPDQVTYSLGADVAMNSRVTLALDGLGRYYVNAERLSQETFHALDAARTPFPNIGFARESFNAVSGSIGLKVNVAGRLLLDGNLLFALDDHGVRDRVVPLFALEYAF